MDVIVFGAGSLGSLIGGLLAREHAVTLVGRNPHVEWIREHGLRIEGHLDTTVHPDARLTPPHSADLAIVTVKAFDTPAASTALAECELDAVLSLQNGMGNEAQLASALDAPVLAGTCTYGAIQDEPGVVEYTGEGTVVLGAREGGPSAVADTVGTAFADADIEVTIAEDMPGRLWEKLAVNAGINATTALARVDNGELESGDAHVVATDAAREVATLARTAGIDLDDDAAATALEDVAKATAENTSSMRQDVLSGSRTEVDAINGFVADRALTAGVETPINRTMAQLLHAWEAARGLR